MLTPYYPLLAFVFMVNVSLVIIINTTTLSPAAFDRICIGASFLVAASRIFGMFLSFIVEKVTQK